MEAVQQFLSFLGLDPSLVGVAFASGVGLRLLRGGVPWFTSSVSYAAAIAIAGFFGALSSPDVSEAGKSVMALLASILVVQRAVQSLAEKVPWLPLDNEWVKKPEGPDAGQGK